jgi:hypothetical protein
MQRIAVASRWSARRPTGTSSATRGPRPSACAPAHRSTSRALSATSTKTLAISSGESPRRDASASYASKPASSQITVVARSAVRPGRSVSCAGASCAGGLRKSPKMSPENQPDSLTSFRVANSRHAHPDRSPCKCTRSSELCSAPERIRTSDLRFRRPTASTLDLALEGEIKRPESPNNRQKLDLAAVGAAGTARASGTRTAAGAAQEARRLRVAASKRARARTVTPAHVEAAASS